MAPDDSSPDAALTQLCINAVRALAIDGVQRADSGHPGTPLALAPLGYLLHGRYLRHNPADPAWPDRDRFVLSCGHASMLLYALLHLSGYDLTLDDLKAFRQWESRTPGHPEHGLTPGVETTTGPLGQGVGNAVGMALAEAHLAARFNRPGHVVVDHRTYFVASDGDLMEGISHESASIAGHLGLGKLIGFYDDNKITIEGATDLAYSEDAGARFASYGWHVEHVADGNDLGALASALERAQRETTRPSLVVVRTHIGFGSPHKVDTAEAHGSPLGVDEVLATKKNLGWPLTEPFALPPEAVTQWRTARDRGAAQQTAWRARWEAYQTAFPAEAGELARRWRGELPAGWDAGVPVFTAKDGNVATRAASQKVLNAIAPALPELVGGSADLAPSTLTLMKGAGDFSAATPGARNLHFGIREHGMGAVLNGMALHGGVRPYGATFLIFSDYMRPAIRLAALMAQPVLYVFTHDSIGLGEDGPTHQPIEQLSTLRTIPGLTLVRPADAHETAAAWRTAVAHVHGPVALVLTRQKVPLLEGSAGGAPAGVARGAYVLAEADGGVPAVVLVATGSEVSLAVEARAILAAEGVAARVVSMPSQELFAAQDASYRDAVLPHGVRRVAVEAGHPMSWQALVGEHGEVVGITRFGASAPSQRIYAELGLTGPGVAAAARRVLAR